jgi:hypothetical protein
MSKALIRSSSRSIQPRHYRRYSSGKITLVNPKVKKILPSKTAPQLPILQKKKKTVAKRRSSKLLARKSDWNKVLTIDKKKIDYNMDVFEIEDFMENLDDQPTRNEVDFEIEIQDKLLEVKNKFLQGVYNYDQAQEKIEEVKEEAEAILQDDMNQPDLSVKYSDEDDDYGYMSTYSEYNTEGLDVHWVKGGGWSGHNEMTLTKDSDWAIAHNDSILAMSEDSAQLEEMDTNIVNYLNNRGIKWARVTTTSSNLFWAPYWFLVEKGYEDDLKDFVEELKEEYRDEERFNRLTNPLYDDVKTLLEKNSPEDLRDRVRDIDPDALKQLNKTIKEVQGSGN